MTQPISRFSLPLKVRYADTDAQGHVFFGTYFTYFDEAVSGYLETIGLPFKKLAELGIDFFYVDAHCQYKGSAVPAELLRADARVERIGNSSIVFACAIHRQKNNQRIADGTVTAVMVDPKTRQPIRVPDAIRQSVTDFEGAAQRLPSTRSL